MDNKTIFRTIFRILIIIASIFYLLHTKNRDHSIEKEALDIELVLVLILGIIYMFTSESPLWRRYGWIWKLVIGITLFAYLIRIIMDRKKDWRNKVGLILLLIFSLVISEFMNMTRNSTRVL